MDLTQGSDIEKRERAKKMMLWFGIVSLIMAFAAWTSAFIVSSSREDWLRDFQLPSAFFASTLVILCSSGTYLLARKAIAGGRTRAGTLWLYVTLAMGLLFIILQFYGFSQMVGLGYYFTGPTSNITMSYIYLIAVVHIAHVAAGLISLLVVLVKNSRGRYSSQNMLGVELGATFWHFVDLLWVYLMVFFYLFR